MWFKQLRVYKLEEKIAYDAEALEAKVLTAEFKHCSALAPISMGFVSMLPTEGAPLVHAANGFLGLRLRVEERLLPATVVRDATDERVKEIEAKEERRVGRKEKQSIKDDTYLQMLPKAFKRSYYIHGFIDTNRQILMINNVSPAKVELFTNTLRKCIGTLKIIFPETIRPARAMTRWITEQTINQDFVIEDSCLLQQSKDEKAKVRMQKQDLFSETVMAHIDDGHEVTQLSLTWREQIRFTFKSDLALAQIQYLEFIEEQRKEYQDEEIEAVLDADFALESSLLAECYGELLALLAIPKDQPQSSHKEQALAADEAMLA